MSAMFGTVGFHGKYGSVELKEVYHRNWTIALPIATVVHFGVIGSYVLSSFFDARTETLRPPKTPMIEISGGYIPPPIGNLRPPAIPSGGPRVKPNVGIPVPVPPNEVDPDQTIADQDHMNRSDLPGDEVGGTGEPAQPLIEIIEEVPPDGFVAAEKYPVVVKRVEPVYPQIALRAGLEGSVTVRVWVDKEGKPSQIEIWKSNADIFNESALAAAKQFLFTPAIMNNNPVSVWVALPFRFALAERK